MWCAQCMQDVPVLPDGSTARCGRCQAVLPSGEHPLEVPAVAEKAVPGGTACSPELLRDELDALQVELLRTRCELETIQAALHQDPEDWHWLWAAEGYLRWDARSVAVRGPRHRPNPPAETPQGPPPSPAPDRQAPAVVAARYLGELLIYLAAMFFSLGSVLAAWAHWGGREQFWPIAWPSLAGSAAGLLLGVLLRAWAGPQPAASAEQKTTEPQVSRSKPLGPHRADQPGLRSPGPHWSPAVQAVAGFRWEDGASQAESSSSTR